MCFIGDTLASKPYKNIFQNLSNENEYIKNRCEKEVRLILAGNKVESCTSADTISRPIYLLVQ